MRRVVYIVALALVGCAPPAREGTFESDDPAAKLYAITRAGQQHDRSKIPALVEQLDSDDPAVRMMSIHALDEITGERLGYNPYDPPEQRRMAIERWVKAVKEKRFAK